MNASECIFFQLAKVNQKSRRFWSNKIGHLNVTAVQGIVLFFLSEEDRLTSIQLGEKTQLDSATLTGVIDRLEEGGLIERKPNPGDRRTILICLTGKGLAASNEIKKIAVKANAEFLCELSESEERNFRLTLQKLYPGQI